MNKSVTTALDRLELAPPSAAPFAVQAVFDALHASRAPPREVATAVRACLDCIHKVCLTLGLQHWLANAADPQLDICAPSPILPVAASEFCHTDCFAVLLHTRQLSTRL